MNCDNNNNNNNNNMVYIYALKDPISHQVRYVGRTNNLKKRFYNHLVPSKIKYKTLKNNWLKHVLKQGLKPEMKIIEVTNNKEWQQKEMYWINYLKQNGNNLTNGTNGGDGSLGHKVSEQHKQKLRELYTGRQMNEQSKIKLSNSLMGNTNGTYGKGVSRGRGHRIELGRKIEKRIILKYMSGKFSKRTLAKTEGVSRCIINRVLEENNINYKNIKFIYVKKSKPKIFSSDKIKQIKTEYSIVKSSRKLANKYGVDRKTIMNVVKLY